MCRICGSSKATKDCCPTPRESRNWISFEDFQGAIKKIWGDRRRSFLWYSQIVLRRLDQWERYTSRAISERMLELSKEKDYGRLELYHLGSPAG